LKNRKSQRTEHYKGDQKFRNTISGKKSKLSKKKPYIYNSNTTTTNNKCNRLYFLLSRFDVTVRRLENSIRTDIEIFQYFKETIDDINVIPL